MSTRKSEGKVRQTAAKKAREIVDALRRVSGGMKIGGGRNSRQTSGVNRSYSDVSQSNDVGHSSGPPGSNDDQTSNVLDDAQGGNRTQPWTGGNLTNW